MTNTTGIYSTVTTYVNDERVKVTRSPKSSRTVKSAQARAAAKLVFVATELIWEEVDVTFTEAADGTASLAWVTDDNRAWRMVGHASGKAQA